MACLRHSTPWPDALPLKNRHSPILGPLGVNTVWTLTDSFSGRINASSIWTSLMSHPRPFVETPMTDLFGNRHGHFQVGGRGHDPEVKDAMVVEVCQAG